MTSWVLIIADKVLSFTLWTSRARCGKMFLVGCNCILLLVCRYPQQIRGMGNLRGLLSVSSLADHGTGETEKQRSRELYREA